jgi:hypothetical protein
LEDKSIQGLAKSLGVPLMSENRNRSRLIEKITGKDIGTVHEAPSSEILPVVSTLIKVLMDRSHALSPNDSRASYAPWFKSLLAGCLTMPGVSSGLLSKITKVPADTILGFRDTDRVDLTKKPLDVDEVSLMDLWNSAPRRKINTLSAFWMYLGCKAPSYKICFNRMRQILIDLGLRSPRGPKIKDKGAQVKRRFEPHAVWEGDGKQIDITVNGERFTFCWYCFIDQKTTLVVGSSLGKHETAEAFLSALKDGKDKAGFYAVGVLIDNRLEVCDEVRQFCHEHGIVLVRTWPGNAKSNGIIEGNFSIFENHVGPVNITGQTPEQIAQSIGLAFVEVFTQQRNHRSRVRTGGKSAAEDAEGATRPEHRRDAIERMRRRFDKEEAYIEEKWKLCSPLLPHWLPLSDESIEKIKRALVPYPALDIVAAVSAFLAQTVKNLLGRYSPEYFLAILRNKREKQAKQVYNEVFRAGMLQLKSLVPDMAKPSFILVPKLVGVIRDILDQPTPAHMMCQLDALAWWFVQYDHKADLPSLWKMVEHAVEGTNGISLRAWQDVAEYLIRRLGCLVYEKGGSSFDNLRKAIS